MRVVDRAPGRIPSLDGLRAISIGMVIIAHLFPALNILGAFGVHMFFVLSGYLITRLLEQEEKAKG